MSTTIYKYHGLGNDYLIYDPNINGIKLTEDRVRLLCDRHYGLGSDGLLLGPVPGCGDDPKVIIYNPDATRAENSGNGVRIFARYLRDAGYKKSKKFDIITDGGRASVEFLKTDSSLSRISLGTPDFWISDEAVAADDKLTFEGVEYSMTCLSLGNPNCVVPVENISSQMAVEMGKCLERSGQFRGGINFNLMKVSDRENIDAEFYERGAGYTYASGTGAAAAQGVAYSLGLTDRKVTVHMPGGDLEVEIAEDGNVYMTGSVESVGITELTGEFEKKLRFAKAFYNNLDV